MADEHDEQSSSKKEQNLVSRPPVEADLVALCSTLNKLKAEYAVVGGYAIIHAGYPRMTGDLDILIDTSPENEAKVFEALRILPDQAVNELNPGDVEKFSVVRIADEITVDLMKSAGGIDYEQASEQLIKRVIQNVEIPFASPRLLWLMKCRTHREKDAGDLVFLRRLIEESGETLPE
jgi:hypothetical protein